jgi:hypothetical protein
VFPTDKNDHIIDISSPTGVDTLQAGILSPTNTANPSGNEQQQTPSNKGVRINETAVHVKPTMTPAGSTPRCQESILHSSTNTRPPDHKDKDKGLTTTTTQLKEIHDRSQKLFHVFSNNGMEETSYHVIDFASLYLSIGTIHGANAKTTTPSSSNIVEIQDNEDAQSEIVAGSWVASNSNSVSGPTANSTPPGASGAGSDNPASTCLGHRAKGGPIGK